MVKPVKIGTVQAIALAAWGLVSNYKTWTKNYSARDANGNGVLTSSKDAVRFCSIGALNVVTPFERRKARENLALVQGTLNAEAQKMGFSGIVDANDTATGKRETLKTIWRNTLKTLKVKGFK